MHQNKQANVRQVHHNEIYMYAPKWFKLYILYALCGHIYLCNIVTQLLSLCSLHKCLFFSANVLQSAGFLFMCCEVGNFRVIYSLGVEMWTFIYLLHDRTLTRS